MIERFDNFWIGVAVGAAAFIAVTAIAAFFVVLAHRFAQEES